MKVPVVLRPGGDRVGEFRVEREEGSYRIVGAGLERHNTNEEAQNKNGLAHKQHPGS